MPALFLSEDLNLAPDGSRKFNFLQLSQEIFVETVTHAHGKHIPDQSKWTFFHGNVEETSIKTGSAVVVLHLQLLDLSTRMQYLIPL
jgi:hypothetical protein